MSNRVIRQETNATSHVVDTLTLVASAPYRWGLLLLIATFAIVYALTLDTGLQPYELHGGDLITHQYAQVQARPGNAPGYPIYTMGGWLWFHGWHSLLTLFGSPYPNPLPILSSYSTLWALVALWLLYAILGNLLGKSRQPWLDTIFCFLLTAFFGVTYFFWYYATTTEQYSSAVAQTLAIVYLYLRWDAEPKKRSLLYWLAFLCGLSLAHMLTIALIVPPLVAIVLWRDPSLLRSPRAIFFAIASAALPLISYLYVYLRGALHPEWWGRGDWATPLAWFWAFVSTAQGRDELAWAFEPGRTFFGNGFPETIWQELSLPLFTLGLIGIALLPRRHAVMFYGTLILYAIFCWLYRFGNWFQVVLPAYPLILVGITPFYAWMQRKNNSSAHIAQAFTIAALCITLIWRVNQSLPSANSRHRAEDTALNHAAILLDQPLPRNAKLFAAVDDALALSYLTEIWGIRPDLKMVSSREANAALAANRKVHATTESTPALIGELAVPPILDGLTADWIEVAPPQSPSATSPITQTIYYTVTPDLILFSYATHDAPKGIPFTPPTNPAIDALLTWQLPTGIWPANLSISLRPTYHGAPILDPATGQAIQQDRSRPLSGLWQDRPISPSQPSPIIVHDTYRLPLPAAADGLLLILYTQNDSGFTNIAEIPLPLAPFP